MPKLPARQPSAPDDIDTALIETAESFLSEHFFDPDAEAAYKEKLAAERQRMGESLVLQEQTFSVRGSDCTMRLSALRTWTMFRVSFDHKEFAAAIEGSWSFDLQELQKPRVTNRRGSRKVWEDALDEIDEFWLDEMSDADVGALLGDDDLDEDDADDPLLDLNPAEPPPATGTDRARVKAIAKRLARNDNQPLSTEDRQWLQDTPQVLPVITEALIAAAKEHGVADPLVSAYGVMLSLELEYVRYRQDRGWDWADDMLEDFQHRLLAFANEGGDPALFMAMGHALSEARVPVSEDMQKALSDAGLRDDELIASGDLQEATREMLSELASQLDTPFEVVETLNRMDAIMPAEARSVLADILASAEQEMMRDAAAILLLDRSPEVRKSVVAALTNALPRRAMSSATLRRLIAIRGWLPEAEREPVDELIRKARLAGIEIGAWPKPLPDTEYHATMIDGSGAQSLLIVSRGTSKGCFRALLLRHGDGIVDAWQEEDLSRGRLNKMLRGTQEEVPSIKVSRDYIDMMVQHAIGSSVEKDSVPPEMFLQIAEGLNGSDWKARRLDIPAEARRLFEALPEADRSESAVERSLGEARDSLLGSDVLTTWFEDGPKVHAAMKGAARGNTDKLISTILDDVLEEHRMQWAERFVLMGMWCQAASDAKQRRMARGLITTAVALVDNRPLAEIPAMLMIAAQTVTAETANPW
ncbi:MAG TPA: hypothetical protein VE690_20400 [Rhodopila sp.]|nr:hypothetical protein [Rhodopila sp.]